jgi:hypothetical protein
MVKMISKEDLVLQNNLLVLQNDEKDLYFLNLEKEKRETELIIANKKLVFQNQEKEKRAAELIIVNKKLVSQNQEKKNLLQN